MPDPLSTNSSPRPSLTRWQLLVVAAILVGYFLLAVSATRNKSATFDEPYHLTSGYAIWHFGDFRLQPQNGNLPQRLAALPLMFGDWSFPSFDQQAWRLSDINIIGPQFFYDVGNDPAKMLLWGRAMVALAGVTVGALVFCWTRRLLGFGAALVSVTLFALCPTMLAHGALTTSDMTAGLFFFAAVAALWQLLQRVTWQTTVTSALVTSALFISKHSAVMLVPMGLILMAVQLASHRAMIVAWGNRHWSIASRARRLALQLALIVIHVIVAWAVVWAAFDFRYEMFHATKEIRRDGEATILLDEPAIAWDILCPEDGNAIDRTFQELRRLRLLPEAYLYGFAHVRRSSAARPAFLNGEFRETGWPQFFPYCLLVKTPPALFLLLALGAAAVGQSWWGAPDDSRRERWRRVRASLYRTAPLWTLFVVYWTFAIPSHLNIGHRHILPTYPPMFMLAGASALWLRRARIRAGADPATAAAPKGGKLPAVLVAASLVLFAGESLWRWPNYLAYFNGIVGGPWYGYRHLVDSSLDWGQDLPGLKQWLDTRHADGKAIGPVYLSYFGLANPDYYAIDATILPSLPPRALPKAPQPLRPGIYCISATMLQGVYLSQGIWTRALEEQYQQTRTKLAIFDSTKSDPQARAELVASVGGQQVVLDTFHTLEELRFGRLCCYLRQREPLAEINYSILIYRVTADTLALALDGPPPFAGE